MGARANSLMCIGAAGCRPPEGN